MSALRMSSTARVDASRVWIDLLIGPVSLALALLFSLLVPVSAQAQSSTGGVSPVLTGGLDNLVARMVLVRNQSLAAGAASSAGLQVAEAGTAAISAGATTVGTVAINEMRVVSLAAIAGRAVTATLPGVVAAIAIDLAVKGIVQCASSGTGWCGPAVSPNSGDTGFNGYGWYCSGGGTGASPLAACWASYRAVAGQFQNASSTTVTCRDAGGYWACGTGGTVYDWSGNATPTQSCVSGYVKNGAACVPDPNGGKVAYSYPQLSPLLADALSGNPNRAKDYWGFMPWTDQMAALGDPSTQALPAQIVSPANGQVSGPRSTTTSGTSTSSSQSTYTVSPNTDGNTLASNPVTLTTTTTTTNPDGTTTTTTTTTPVTDGGGSNPQPQAASAPIPCGLGTSGSPKCQIDETGTPTKTDAATAMAQPATDLQTAEQAGEAQLKNVNNGLNWSLHMPHILPGGTCQPIEWFVWGNWRGSWDLCTQLQYVRDLLSWLWPTLAAIYVWNKAAGANAGVA